MGMHDHASMVAEGVYLCACVSIFTNPVAMFLWQLYFSIISGSYTDCMYNNSLLMKCTFMVPEFTRVFPIHCKKSMIKFITSSGHMIILWIQIN